MKIADRLEDISTYSFVRSRANDLAHEAGLVVGGRDETRNYHRDEARKTLAKIADALGYRLEPIAQTQEAV